MAKHINRAHRNLTAAGINNAFQEDRWVDCNVCGFICCRQKGLITHLATHAVELPGEVDDNPAGAEEIVADGIEQVIYWAEPLPAEPEMEFEGLENVAEEEIAAEELELQDEVGLPIPGGISLGDLVAMYKTGLYKSHPTWLPYCKGITQSLLEQAVDADGARALRGIAALQLFPGLIEYCNNARGEVLRPIAFLRCVSVHPDRASEIIRWARLWAALRQERAAEWGEANAESIRRRVEGYVKDGRLSLATNTLAILQKILKGVPLPVEMSRDQMQARVDELHPAADHRDILPDEAADPGAEDCISITAEQLRDKFYILKMDSGSGSTAWTNKFLRFIGEDRDYNLPMPQVGGLPPNALHQAFAAFANKMFRGEIVGEARELLVTARLIMVPKPDGGLRPITIQCAIQRMLGTLANDEARRILGNYLRPIQLGGGFRSGAEILAREMAAAYEQGDLIMKVDISNAFNTTRRRKMFDQVMERVPGIARYFRFQYGREADLRGNQGSVIATSATGVGQGHPCSPLYFELGIHAALLELAAKVGEIEDEQDLLTPHDPVGRKGSVTAYEDDTLIRGEARIMNKIGPLVAAHFETHGFVVKIVKSKITGRNIAATEGLPEGFGVEPSGFTVMGIPIGELAYCQSQAATMLKEMAPPPEALKALRPRSAYQLLSKCYNARPTYLLRTAQDLEGVTEAARDFDTAVTGAVAATLLLPVTEELTTRIYLSKKGGGLGFTRHCGMATEKNQICSRLLHVAFITRHHPDDAALTQLQYNMRAIRMGTLEDIEEHTEIGPGDYEGMDEDTGKKTLRNGKTAAETRIADDLHLALRESPDHQSQAAWFLSSTNGGTSFLDSTIGIAVERYFGDEEFVYAARMKLGVGPTNDPPETVKVCVCGTAYQIGMDPFHAISCHTNHHQRTYCHTDIVDLLYTLLKTRYPLAAIQKEKEVGQTAPIQGPAIGIRADIVATIGPITYVIDVSTVDPGNTSSLSLNPSSASNQDAAAIQREKIKHRHYRRVVTPAALDPACVIPFVIETSGRLGPQAIAFLSTVCSSQKFLRSRFLNNVVMCVAKQNGKMLKATRNRFN